MLSGSTSNRNLPLAVATDTYSAYDINEVTNKVDLELKNIIDNINTISTNLSGANTNITANSDKITECQNSISNLSNSANNLTNLISEINTTISQYDTQAIRVDVHPIQITTIAGMCYVDSTRTLDSTQYELIQKIPVIVTRENYSGKMDLATQSQSLNYVRVIINCDTATRTVINVITLYRKKAS